MEIFGIKDIGIILPYFLSFACVGFAIWYGITRWNKDDSEDSKE